MQRRWTREINGMEELSYEGRLRQLDLYSVWGRLLRKDLLKIWKVIHSEVDSGVMKLFDMRVNSRVRGHRFRMRIPVCRTDLRRRSFAVRCVGVWNCLPSEVVECESVGGFKGGLDRCLRDKFFEFL